jgi:cytochrome P450
MTGIHTATPRQSRGVPRPPGPRLAIVELLRALHTRRPTSVLERVAAKSGTIAHFRLAGEHAYLLTHPDLIRDLLVAQGRATAKGRGLERARRLLGQGLLTSEGELHRRQRRLIQPAFHGSRIARYAEQMCSAAADLTERPVWTDGARRDVAADMRHLTLAIVGETLFATDVSADSTAVAHALTEIVERFGRTILGSELLDRLPLPGRGPMEAAQRELDRVVYSLIEQHRQAGATESGGDVLSTLLATRDEDGQPMADRQIRDEVLTLLLAGHETTANALAWSWLLLDRNPAAAHRLHAEVDALAGPPRLADWDNLQWTHAVLAESMRIYPPAWVVGRRVLTDLELDGWTVPARSLCIASQWITHRDPRWWPEPLAFRPERWIAEDGRFDEAAPGQPRGAYFPFGLGRRVCIGESFAWTEGVLVLATLAREWAPALVPGHPVDIRPAVTLRPAHGLPMVLHRRR